MYQGNFTILFTEYETPGATDYKKTVKLKLDFLKRFFYNFPIEVMNDVE